MEVLFLFMLLTPPIAFVLFVLGVLTGTLNKPVPRWLWIFLGGLVLLLAVAVWLSP